MFHPKLFLDDDLKLMMISDLIFSKWNILYNWNNFNDICPKCFSYVFTLRFLKYLHRLYMPVLAFLFITPIWFMTTSFHYIRNPWKMTWKIVAWKISLKKIILVIFYREWFIEKKSYYWMKCIIFYEHHALNKRPSLRIICANFYEWDISNKKVLNSVYNFLWT